MPKEDYDITEAFRKIEDELIASMIRNMERHRAEEDKEGFLWSQWQVEQLKALEQYKLRNQKKYTKQFRLLNKRVEELIKMANDTGNMEQEIEILEAIKNGFQGYRRASSTLQAEFFLLNERKLEALVKATVEDMETAETAILRMSDDVYRKAIFNAQVYANTGAGTYEKAVDMAVKDMLAAGLNCVQYANGARHTLKEYANMAIRTACTRAYLQGEGVKRQEWGIATVIMNKRGKPCPKCLPWAGKVLIDDVWSGGTAEGAKYPLMSYAISKGLYHPNCRDSHTTYFPGLSTADDTWTKEELEKVGLEAREEARQQYARRQADKYSRIGKYSLDEENRKRYLSRSQEWNKEASLRFKNFEDLEKYMKEEYNGNIDADVKSLDIKQVNQTFAEMESVLMDFPEARRAFKGIDTAGRGTAAVIPNGELLLNPLKYRSQNGDLIGTGYHEAGHILELALIRKANSHLQEDAIYELYKNGAYAKDIVNKAYKRIKSGKTLRELRAEISGYALKDESETLSEAVKDYYMNGYLASVLSRQIIKVLEERLK
ncbi:MAG: hypothetical protein HFH83_04515 [Lachnospiraceae bacterium]|jgi:hypothetical protein|nr:hypothetical protein [Lachnospiraceae bacterium]